MRLLLDGAKGPSRECSSTCLFVEAVCLEFKLTEVSILSFNREMQQLLESFNIWGKLNRHPCIQESCAFGPLGLLLVCRLVRKYRARAPSAFFYVYTVQSLRWHVLVFVRRSGMLQETIARSSWQFCTLLACAVSCWFVFPQAPLNPRCSCAGG